MSETKQEFQWTKNQLRVYKALKDHGPLLRDKVASIPDFPALTVLLKGKRTTIYDALESLEDYGIVRRFIAEDEVDLPGYNFTRGCRRPVMWATVIQFERRREQRKNEKLHTVREDNRSEQDEGILI